MVQNGFDVTEYNAGLVLVFGKAYDSQSLANRDKWLEVDKAGNETGNQGRDERFSTTVANNDEVRLSP